MKIEIEGGPFKFIMADPPWAFATYSAKGKEKSADKHYQCMSLDDIKSLDVASIADKDCLLWLWATAPMDEQAHEVIKAWDFTYVSQGVWHKVTGNGKPAFGTGYYLRNNHEPFYLAKRGKPKVASRSVRSTIVGVLREHSRKPEEAYLAAEQLVGDVTKADLFSRQSRPGWSNWGNETDKFDQSSALSGILGAMG